MKVLLIALVIVLLFAGAPMAEEPHFFALVGVQGGAANALDNNWGSVQLGTVYKLPMGYIQTLIDRVSFGSEFLRPSGIHISYLARFGVGKGWYIDWLFATENELGENPDTKLATGFGGVKTIMSANPAEWRVPYRLDLYLQLEAFEDEEIKMGQLRFGLAFAPGSRP